MLCARQSGASSSSDASRLHVVSAPPAGLANLRRSVHGQTFPSSGERADPPWRSTAPGIVTLPGTGAPGAVRLLPALAPRFPLSSFLPSATIHRFLSPAGVASAHQSASLAHVPVHEKIGRGRHAQRDRATNFGPDLSRPALQGHGRDVRVEPVHAAGSMFGFELEDVR